jgi:hypothetical protein
MLPWFKVTLGWPWGRVTPCVGWFRVLPFWMNGTMNPHMWWIIKYTKLITRCVLKCRKVTFSMLWNLHRIAIALELLKMNGWALKNATILTSKSYIFVLLSTLWIIARLYKIMNFNVFVIVFVLSAFAGSVFVIFENCVGYLYWIMWVSTTIQCRRMTAVQLSNGSSLKIKIMCR